jgi:iron complex outermembrane receptor protein
LLNREERGRIEVNQPRDKLILTLSYAIEHADFFVQTTRFGEITTIAPQDPAQDQTFSARFVTDLAFAYRVNSGLSFTIGANNVFDVYPDRVADPRLTNNGTVPYSRFATQFGFNGAAYFAKWDFVF